MNISVDYSTPKGCLSATKQAVRESGVSQDFCGGKQLSLFESLQSTERGGFQKPPRPQISSIPGILPKERDRYQVKLGDRVLGTHVSIDEALRIAKRGGR